MATSVQSVPSLRHTMQLNAIPEIARHIDGVVEGYTIRDKGTLLSIRVGSESYLVLHERDRIEGIQGAFAKVYLRSEPAATRSTVRRAYRTDISFREKVTTQVVGAEDGQQEKTVAVFTGTGDWDNEHRAYGSLDLPSHTRPHVVDEADFRELYKN